MWRSIFLLVIGGAFVYAQNVGIGIATPTERLHVAGNLRFDGALMPNNLPGTAGQVLVSQGPNVPPIWVDYAIASRCAGAGKVDTLIKWTGINQACNSIIYDNDTFVAIGAIPATTTFKFLTYGVGTNPDAIIGVALTGGWGVYGFSPDAFGVVGYSPQGTGVSGFTDTIGPGVYGLSTYADGVGVLGVGNNVGGVVPTAGCGVAGTGDSIGVFGRGNYVAVVGNAAVGQQFQVPASGTGGAFTGTAFGVGGFATATTGDRAGGYFTEANAVAYVATNLTVGINTYQMGITASDGSALYVLNNTGGVFSGLETGVAGYATGATGGRIGGDFEITAANSPTGYVAYITNTGEYYGGMFTTGPQTTDAFSYIAAENTGVGTGSFGGYFDNGATAYAFVAINDGLTDYKIIGSGSVSTIIKAPDNTHRTLFAPEAPEILFMDFGQGQLKNGRAHITLDPIFANAITVDEDHPLRVFIQLEDECNGVYVTNKTKNGFDVIELNGGTSNAKFTWYVVANRADTYDEQGRKVSENDDVRFPIAPPRLTKKILRTKATTYTPQQPTTPMRTRPVSPPQQQWDKKIQNRY